METSLKEKLNQDLKQALRNKDRVRCLVIRAILSAVNYSEMAKQAPSTDSDVLGVIAREAKQHDESILAFKQGNRPDLVAKEEAELAIIKEYLPRQLTHDEIVAEAKKVIADVGAQGPRDRGKVMPVLIAHLKGKADGREINAVVSELLK